jgi:hypothetical protein
MKMARKLDVSSSEIEKVSVCDFEIKVKIIFFSTHFMELSSIDLSSSTTEIQGLQVWDGQ